MKVLSVFVGLAFAIVGAMMPNILFSMVVGALGGLIVLHLWCFDHFRTMSTEDWMKLPKDARAAELQRMKNVNRMLDKINRRTWPVVVTLSIAIVLKAVYDSFIKL